MVVVDAAQRLVELGRARAWFVWALAVMFVVYYFSFQTGYAIVNSNVQKDIGLSFIAGWDHCCGVHVDFCTMPVLQRCFAGPARRGKIIPASIALVTVGIFVFANAENYGTLLLSQLIIAVGACSGFVGAGYIRGQWFGMTKFSFMFGLVQFAASFFSAFNQNLLSLALSEVPWRDLFNFIGVFGVALFILGALFIKNPTAIPARSAEGVTDFFAEPTKSIVEVIKIPHVWVASAFGALCFGVMLGLGVDSQVVGGPRIRCSYCKLVGVSVVARPRCRLLCGS